ncbi:MAG: hypothetical protein IPK67_18710 [Planctomycetes bacterium]|nr:hypothetical protein [Planctomycetota bacterium]
MAKQTDTSRVVEFKPKGEEPKELTVANGDGLRYIGLHSRVVCPHFRSRQFFHRGGKGGPDLVLVGAPPQGSTDADLRAGGIGGCVTLDMVELVSGSGQWLHVPAASMAGPLGLVEAARLERSKPKAESDEEPE